MRKNEEEHGAVLLRYGKNILFGGIIALALCLVLLLIAAFGISRGILSPSMRYQLTVAACVLGSFCGGGLAVGQCGGTRGLFVGMAVGGVLFLLQLTIGILLYDTFSLDGGALGLLFGALCGGAAAGILVRGGGRRSGVREKKKRRR